MKLRLLFLPPLSLEHQYFKQDINTAFKTSVFIYHKTVRVQFFLGVN